MLSMPRIVRPDPFRIRETEIGSPARSTTHRSLKRNKELAGISKRIAASQARLRLPGSSGKRTREIHFNPNS
jgi:hypothetical protein